ncbi:MAG: ArsR/SmtB family transcription factor [Bacillota bacterium]
MKGLVPDQIREFQAALFRALGHPTRLTVVEILATEGEKCVCELVQRLGFDQSTVSKHLTVLKSAGIVKSRKRGLNVFYYLNVKCAYQFMKCVEQLLRDGRQIECTPQWVEVAD